MKKMMLLLVMMTTMVVKAAAITYTQARAEALFLTDKMAYELSLSREQCEAVYEINIDYLMAVDSKLNIYGWAWERRNSDLRYVLTAYQYDLYMQANYFYRPISWRNNSWRMRIYKRYGERTVYYTAPLAYNSYRGGNNSRQSNYYANRNYNKPTHVTPPPTVARPNNGTSNHGSNTANGKATTSWRSGSSGQSTSSGGSGSSWSTSSSGNASSQRSNSPAAGSSSSNHSQQSAGGTKTASGGQFKGKR